MNNVSFIALLFVSATIVCQSNEFIDLTECQRRALDNNPALLPLESELKSHDGLIEQAGLSPNPELEFEAENFLGSGEFQSVDGIETTLAVSQTFETADKRRHRINLANNQKRTIEDQLEIERLTILYQTTEAFINTLFTQERLEVERSFYEISQKTYQTIRASVEAGRSSPLEEVRANVMASSSQISMERIQKHHEKNKLNLSSQWASVSPSFNQLKGSLLPIPNIDDIETKLSLLSDHPEMEKARNEIRAQESFYDLQQSNATPDFEIAAGVRYLSEVDDGAFVVGFSIPLPLRNRNQGAIRAAKERTVRFEKEKAKTEFAMHSQLHLAYVDYQQANQEVSLLQNDVIPSAQIAFDSALEGYRQGKFAYLTVLDAQRSLFELKVRVLESALDVHKAINKINHLTASYDVLNTQGLEAAHE